MKNKTCGCQGACSGASSGDQAVTVPFRAREMDRREFMATAVAGGAGLAAAAAGLPIVAGPFERLASASVALQGRPLDVQARHDGRQVIVTLPAGTVVDAQSDLAVRLRW